MDRRKAEFCKHIEVRNIAVMINVLRYSFIKSFNKYLLNEFSVLVTM